MKNEELKTQELWYLWRKFYHDLMAHPVSINLLLAGLENRLPEFIAACKEGRVDNEQAAKLEKSVSLLRSAIQAHIWLLGVKRMQLAPLDATAFPLEKCSMATCLKAAFSEFPADGLYGIKKLSVPRIKNFYFLGNAFVMQNIIFNLLDNAFYGMRHKGKINNEQLQIFTTSDSLYNYLHVKNQGAIAPEILPKLFTKFFTTKTSKAGLGLYFCRKAMQFFGGEISCNFDQKNKYCEFILKFAKV